MQALGQHVLTALRIVPLRKEAPDETAAHATRDTQGQVEGLARHVLTANGRVTLGRDPVLYVHAENSVTRQARPRLQRASHARILPLQRQGAITLKTALAIRDILAPGLCVLNAKVASTKHHLAHKRALSAPMAHTLPEWPRLLDFNAWTAMQLKFHSI